MEYLRARVSKVTRRLLFVAVEMDADEEVRFRNEMIETRRQCPRVRRMMIRRSPWVKLQKTTFHR